MISKIAEVSDSGGFGRAFVACFSMSPNLCVHVWDEIKDELPSAMRIFHLLLVLLILKLYGMEDTMVVMVQTTWKTYQMGKDSCRRNLFINICKLTELFVCLIVALY